MSAAGPTFRFRPPWWATLGTLCLGAVFATAGFWQLSRAEAKRALFAGYAAGAASAPGNETPAPGAGDAALPRYARIVASGRYDTEHQILLDARTRQGRAGYEVLTPLLGDGLAVLVNRGWVPADLDRAQLPGIAVGDGPRSVSGLSDRLPRAVLVAPSPAEPGAAWPRRLLFPTAAEIGAALGYPVADYQLLLAPDAPEGYLRDWRPELMAPEQHLGYAVQWFAMAAALVVLYVALNFRRISSSPPT